ncbi:uncharacterized protein [Leptinotarsa decemlineata]|uniref:uncharacterized protein n=1 Tax=Leptinotarsa decemlineata TaxID=7539 RepID=UPI000C253963|nr:putative glycine-rich cell wall structural protein 1 [Leptinotarsa decemlineata]
MEKIVSILFLVFATTVNGGFLTGHHPYPAVISSRTVVSGAVGGGPTNGAYSSSQSSQTVSSPSQLQSSISTFLPAITYGYSSRQNQNGQNQGGQGGQGQNGQNQGQGGYGYSANSPSVLAYGTYGFGQAQNGQGQNGQGQNGQGQNGQGYGGQGNQNQGQRGYNGNSGAGQGVSYSSSYNYGHY